jgi:peptidoglycan/LPS O-acetylase OafA/YrhL
VVYSIYIAVFHEFTPSNISFWADFKRFDLNYIKPIPRIPSFVIGVILGLVYLKAKSNKSQVSVAYSVKDSWAENFENFVIKVVNNEGIRKSFYFIGFVFIAFSTLTPYIMSEIGEVKVGVVICGVFLAVERIFFSLGFSIFIISMLFGYLQVIASILKLKIFSVLAKISYTMYLIHPTLYVGFFMMENEMYKADFKGLQYNFVVVLGGSLVVSTILQIIIESPFISLSKKYLSR